MDNYNALRYLRVAVSYDLRTIPQHILDYITNLKVKNFVHEVHYKTDKPKIIELGDAMDTNPYHFFFYMIARFYYFDHGDNLVYYYYPEKELTYFTRMALESLPKRFICETTKRDTHEYIEMPGCEWYGDSIDEFWIYVYVRDLYKDIWSSTKQEKGKFSYISRNKVVRKVRMILNEEELFTPLKNLGFSIYYMEDLTFDQQIKLFRSSEIITGFHGAGLSYLIFCEPGTRVHEINDYQQKDLKNHYVDISAKCDLRYSRFSNLINVEDGMDNRRIDCVKFIDSLKSIM
jgi:Glycosyltransferase 61